MKFIKFFVLTLSLAFVCLPSMSQALPKGSYQSTCYRCTMQRSTMTCWCKKRNDMPRLTKLARANSCKFVENLNGHLVCGHSADKKLPRGSYQKTCVDCKYNGHKLACRCRMANGFYLNQTTLRDANRCQGGITNINGKLNCRLAMPKLPAGSYKKTCKRCRYAGNSLQCVCRTRNQRYVKSLLPHAKHCDLVKNVDGQLNCIKRH